MTSTTKTPRAEEERGVPKPQPQRPIVSNPSTPGVQKPPNRPGGRDAPPGGETRGKLSAERVDQIARELAELAEIAAGKAAGREFRYRYPNLAANLAASITPITLRYETRDGRLCVVAAVAQRPRERRARRTTRSSSRAGPSDSDPPAKRRRLSAAERRALKLEVDRRTRERLAAQFSRERGLVDGEARLDDRRDEAHALLAWSRSL